MECGRHLNIQILTQSQVVDIKGAVGKFRVTVKEQPRYVHRDRCIACGECALQCPQKNESKYERGGTHRKAIFIKYPQAVPLSYQIEPRECLAIQKPGSCGLCDEVCDAGAINFNDKEKSHTLSVGALIFAPGYEPFDPQKAGVWGYGKFPDVLTSFEFEHLLASSGPTQGKLLRPSDGKAVNRVAFLQCIGSRDKNRCKNEYCSSVCCMTAVKEAVVAKKRNPWLAVTIYYIDMRTHGKGFEEYYHRAKNEDGVRFVRCRLHGIESQKKTGELRLHYINENGKQIEEDYEMVVLSVGMGIPQHTKDLARIAGIQLTASDFSATSDFAPVLTSTRGIFTCGAFSGPKDIPHSITEGSAAAAAASEVLALARGELTHEIKYPHERDVSVEEPRIGVFICHCGSNIAGALDVEILEKEAKQLAHVIHAERNLFSCAQDTQVVLKKAIVEEGINRVVIAACTPRSHEHLFRETLKSAGLNEHLVEMANIRNQNAWVHSNPEKATDKANDLIRMAVAKVGLAKPYHPATVSVIAKGLVVGGGISGMTAALNLANQGFAIFLVEKSSVLGGNALNLKHTYSGEHVPMQVKKLAESVTKHAKITLLKESQIVATEGYAGRFKTVVKTVGKRLRTLQHGITIIATGGSIFSPDEYGYTSYRNVVTSIEFEKLHELKERHVKRGKNFVFIQCVGSRQEGRMYCSKVCCTHSVQSAIELKREDPARNVYILYRDMRTYGEREYLFAKARELGVIFINYELHGKPEVEQKGSQIAVKVQDHVLNRQIIIDADMVILAAAIVANKESENLARTFNVAVDSDGFFQEAHAKIRPIDFNTDGVFTAGLAHYPKPVDESVTQALAAASRASTILSQSEIYLDSMKAIVVKELCDGCALCVDACPFQAIDLYEVDYKEGEEPTKLIAINEAKCKGCGVCQGTCPKRGVYVTGFTMEQLSAQIRTGLNSK